MKKDTQKPPIDDLFARKLNNVSLSPSPDGFERLQVRLGQSKPEARIVFWRNPLMQRYMAAAACLVVVCLIGWQNWPSDSKTTGEAPKVAMEKGVPVRNKPALAQTNTISKQPDSSVGAQSTNVVNSIESVPEPAAERVAHTVTAPESAANGNRLKTPASKVLQPTVSIRTEPMLAHTNPDENKSTQEAVRSQTVTPVNQPIAEQVATSKTADTPVTATERVLVVTIAEPEALVAARQAAKASVEEKSLATAHELTEKETKAGGLWQRVKRIKEGEIFAQRDKSTDDERGLLTRAYTGLKYSLEKDKSTKQ